MPLPIFDFGAARRLPQQPNPNAVRAYIRHLLTTKLDTTPKYAELVAKNWHLGQSRDLYEASAKHLSNLFGQDVGPILFRLVHEDIWEDWWNSYQGLLGSGTFLRMNLASRGKVIPISRSVLDGISFTGSLLLDPCM